MTFVGSSLVIGDKIGRGQFATVYKALNIKSGELLAVKRIQTQYCNDQRIEAVMVCTSLYQFLHDLGRKCF